MKIFFVLLFALVLSACATKPDPNYAAYLAAHQATEASKAQRPLFVLEGMDGQEIQLKGVKRLAVFMPDTAGSSGVALPPQPARPWYAEVARDVIGGYVGYKGGQVMWNAVGGLGNAIERAGTHGYQFVQAPGAVTTTTTTNTSTNTTTTTNSNNTTRNCAGGAAAPGGAATGTTGAVTGGSGAAGGSASC